MAIPEHVVCCSKSFLSQPAEEHLTQRIEKLRLALEDIIHQEGGGEDVQRLRELARAALEQDHPYPKG